MRSTANGRSAASMVASIASTIRSTSLMSSPRKTYTRSSVPALMFLRRASRSRLGTSADLEGFEDGRHQRTCEGLGEAFERIGVSAQKRRGVRAKRGRGFELLAKIHRGPGPNDLVLAHVPELE